MAKILRQVSKENFNSLLNSTKRKREKKIKNKLVLPYPIRHIHLFLLSIKYSKIFLIIWKDLFPNLSWKLIIICCIEGN